MNKSAFLKLIQQVSNISDQQTEELEKVAATFPYCQTAHLLLAKSAYDKGSMLSTQRLRRASAYATNRQLLKRIIYTAPAPEPVFDEQAIEEVQPAEEAVIPVQEDTLVFVEEEEQEENVTFHAEAAEVVPDEEEVLEEEAPTAIPETALRYEQETAEEAEEDEALFVDESLEEFAATEDILEQPMEKLNSELALLLTINSLSPSFTDLLAQRADEEETEETRPAAADLADETLQLAADELRARQEGSEDTLAQLIEEESRAFVQASYAYIEEYSPSAPAAEQDDLEEERLTERSADLGEGKVTAPEEAEINYAFGEIDRMYAEDSLGYWMASSRMGESLQLKDEVTRQRPQGFHPELILEYSKTHELEKPVEQAPLSLHNQLNIIDQFLRLNPRLKTMNNIKLKPEPQEDLSLKSTKIKKGVASESLANIFIKQGKEKKAIKIYEQLILKYPEKKSYFAEQIEKLQNLN
ncbi:hypothetical protein CLV24_102346 [Pontibacter ummariensis]|uniref:Tetratricopeptide repeat-containing protein n=1 Tax=Pontibacter ummariensis TaxID=1610492 RepID=A0A239BQS5_9BACT|nr:hypothetical protein [Pontibacter ummariensis]PRY15722.1 hypothetical protein CLV24_102346 [Pontibacter ummariensis]SNS09404.1 hypothetical protein SAMN06296052_10266 [Pontibacter ummariensis]